MTAIFLQWDNELNKLPNLETDVLYRNFHDVFGGLPLPELSGSAADVNKKVPAKWQDNASLSLEYILGIKCESRISEQEWVLSYYNPLHLEDADNKSFYIVNAEGVITAYYPREQSSANDG